MSRYTDTCERCGFTYVKGNIHFGDTCDRQKALREAGMPSSGIQAELNALRRELTEWRSGKRRVFFRVRWQYGGSRTEQDWGYKREAVEHAKTLRGAANIQRVMLRRVTVGPAKKKGAK